MRRHLPVRTINYLKTHLQKKKWRRVVTALSCIVVFCTTYALILPSGYNVAAAVLRKGRAYPRS